MFFITDKVNAITTITIIVTATHVKVSPIAITKRGIIKGITKGKGKNIATA